MTYSPSRRYNPSHPYTQLRPGEPITSQFRGNRSQYSPDLSSPRLNAQSQYQRIEHTEDLKHKLETILKHNSQLLNENALLSQMVNALRVEISALKLAEKAITEDLTLQIANKELQKTLDTLQHNQFIHEKELQRLLNEISLLHDQMYEIQNRKDAEIRQLKERYQRQMANQTFLMKRVGEQSKEVKDLQIKKFRQALEVKEFEIEALNSKHKSDFERFTSENQSLKNEIKHVQQLKQIEINEEKSRVKSIINTNMKHIEREKMIQIAHYENSIKKLKKEVTNKNIQIEQKSKTNTLIQQEAQSEIISIKAEKERLLEQLKDAQQEFSKALNRQKRRLNELAEMEKENLQNIMESEKDCLRAETQKLNALIIVKNTEIRRLFEALEEQKDAFKIEAKLSNDIIIALRAKLKQIQADNLEQLELLKIKMAQLHQSDIKSLQTYYENELAALITENRELGNLNTINKEKWYEMLQKNDQNRKTFEVQISKQKARVLDLKVKLAALQVQHKEQITSLGTKMELTSQTLLREADQKHKGQAFFEAEKKKFYSIINSKDKQIASLNQTMEKLKKLHSQEKQANRHEIAELKTQLLEKDKEMRQAKREMEREFDERRERLMEQVRKSPDQQLVKENHVLKDRIQKCQAELFAKQKQLGHLQNQFKSLQQELGLKAGFIQTMQLESQAAIEDQKSKMKILMGENEISMKNYFEDRLNSRERDNAGLREQLASKEKDIRELIVKYNSLEGKLRGLLQAQQKLEGFYQKVISMGLDQNLVKNVAQMFARYRQ